MDHRSDTSQQTVAIVGQGYVGLPVSMAAVDAGFRVIGFDTDDQRVAALAASRSFVDDVPDYRLARANASGRFRPTSAPAELAGFDVAVISVPTPLSEGVPDLSHIEQAARLLGPHVRSEACVVLESTTYPGTTQELVQPILEEASGLAAEQDFALGYSPSASIPATRAGRSSAYPRSSPGSGPVRFAGSRLSSTSWWTPPCRSAMCGQRR